MTGIPLPPAHRGTVQVRGTEAMEESRGQSGTKRDLVRAPMSLCLPDLNVQAVCSHRKVSCWEMCDDGGFVTQRGSYVSVFSILLIYLI